MRKFIIKTVLFVSFLIIPIVIVSCGYYIILNNSNYWDLPKNTDYIVLGHSHPECAFNDSLILGLVNLGKSGESYFYTYLKAKKVIPNNKTLKAVFIEFGNNNINIRMDAWTWDDLHVQQNFPLYFPLFDYSDFKFLMAKNSKAILNCPPNRYLIEIGYSYLSSFINRSGFLSNTRFGGYFHLDKILSDSIQKNSLSNYNNNDIFEKDISDTNLKYLQKIIELCGENSIEVFLIRSPVHSKYITSNCEIEFQRVLNSYFQNIDFLDFAQFPVQNNEYGDLGHLNYIGSRKFSIWFNQNLEYYLLNEADQQTIEQ